MTHFQSGEMAVWDMPRRGRDRQFCPPVSNSSIRRCTPLPLNFADPPQLEDRVPGTSGKITLRQSSPGALALTNPDRHG
jgi:hypothetical protein